MTILDQIREASAGLEKADPASLDRYEYGLGKMAYEYRNAVAFELEGCRVGTCDAGRVLVGSRGRCLISGTLGEKACVDETSALRNISGPVRVTVIVQPAEPEMQPETALEKARAAVVKILDADPTDEVGAALYHLVQALETRL